LAVAFALALARAIRGSVAACLTSNCVHGIQERHVDGGFRRHSEHASRSLTIASGVSDAESSPSATQQGVKSRSLEIERNAAACKTHHDPYWLWPFFQFSSREQT